MERTEYMYLRNALQFLKCFHIGLLQNTFFKKKKANVVCFLCSPGIYTFGLFATDIFVNAGQVVTGNLAPHFLALCKPNYTALGCQQYTQFISGEEACTGNPDLIMRARKTFPSKEAALSVYAAMYLTVSNVQQCIVLGMSFPISKCGMLFCTTMRVVYRKLIFSFQCLICF